MNRGGVRALARRQQRQEPEENRPKFKHPTAQSLDLSHENRHQYSLGDRAKMAAVCVVRATYNKNPVTINPKRFRATVLVQSSHYRRFIKFASLVHMWLTFLEVPPKLITAPPAEVEAAGYWTTASTGIDGGVCCVLGLHVLLLLYTSPLLNKTAGKWTIVDKPRFLLVVVVVLLTLDFCVSFGSPAARPLRALRPIVFILLNDRMQYFMHSCVLTFFPLVKAFALIQLALIFYSIVGLSLFSGVMSSTNTFGAACITLSGTTHPFASFGYAFLNMYALSTGDAHPQLVWPFLSCSCKFTNFETNNSTVVALENGCNMRRATATLFFVSFMVVVFFCLGAAVLAVCYHFFEQISKEHIIHRIIQRRCGLIAAHHFLQDTTSKTVSKVAFLRCMQYIEYMMGRSLQNQGDFIWKQMDLDESRGLSYDEFFMLPDLLLTKVKYKTNSDKFPWYAAWKKTVFRNKLLATLRTKTPFFDQIYAIDFLMLLLVLVNAILASVESTRTNTQSAYADYTTGVFVLEVMLKMAGFGVGTYWLDLWNRFDFFVTVLSVLVIPVAYSGAASDLGALLKLVPCIRLMRLMKVLSILRGGESTESYYKRLLNSLATTVPVCLEALLLLFFYLYIFALFGMIMMGKNSINTRLLSSSAGSVDYIYKEEFGYDWADMESALWTALSIIVGNTWSTFMFNAVAAKGLGVGFFMIFAHFLGVFLLLNIIQSVFVFAFSMLLDDDSLRTTLEWYTRDNLNRIIQNSNQILKNISRNSSLDYLMATPADVERAYEDWVVNRRAQVLNARANSSRAKGFFPVPKPKLARGATMPESDCTTSGTDQSRSQQKPLERANSTAPLLRSSTQSSMNRNSHKQSIKAISVWASDIPPRLSIDD